MSSWFHQPFPSCKGGPKTIGVQHHLYIGVITQVPIYVRPFFGWFPTPNSTYNWAWGLPWRGYGHRNRFQLVDPYCTFLISLHGNSHPYSKVHLFLEAEHPDIPLGNAPHMFLIDISLDQRTCEFLSLSMTHTHTQKKTKQWGSSYLHQRHRVSLGHAQNLSEWVHGSFILIREPY